LTRSTARKDDALWAAVGDPTRRRLLDTLLARGEASATSLATELPVTRQAVAKHLAVLDRAGLVDSEKVGREVIYAVRTAELDEVSRAMAKVAAA
jgi:DNA-binding transcriptional ArsR family regulator